MHWGRRILYVLEFTRPNDWAGDWQDRTDTYKDRTDTYKEERYAPLRNMIAGLLPGWKVETIAFALGIRGSYNEKKWREDLEKFKVPGPTIAAMMQQMVTRCLALLGDLYNTRRAATRVR